MNASRLLLISNSRKFGGGYLEHCADAVRTFLGSVQTVLFVPYALKDMESYTATARGRFQELGFELVSVHEMDDPFEAVSRAQAVFIGGGNTFRLLRLMYKYQLVSAIRERVIADMPYIGSSAGSNVACPTICTTNDMPIVHLETFQALNLVPFQINPHYLDPDPNSKHMGETRETRIKEYHEENSLPVVGLREGSWLRVEGNEVFLEGSTGARIFTQGSEPFNADSGLISDLVGR